MRHLALPLALACLATAAVADSPVIERAEATRSGMGWRFDVTISHPDTGWDHYADGGEILTPDGKRLGMRKLHHPHVDEQPFTRSLSNVMVPDGLRQVQIRPRCSVDGWTGAPVTVALSPGG
jgi:hypothetical protein